MSLRTLTLGLGLLLAADCAAHEGEAEHHQSAPLYAGQPHRLDDGELYLPEPAQRLLGVRSEAWPLAAAAAPRRLLAEVQAQPETALQVVAPEPGLLEAPESGWPLPGQAVEAGAVLAWLRPQIGQREAAKRRAEVADLDQKLVMDNLNVERLALQGAVNPDNQVATGNIYFEEAQTRRDAERKQRELIAESLKDRAAVRAQVSGRVLAAAARAGEVVAAGQGLFQLADPRKLRLAALSYDPRLGASLRSASLSGGSAPLEFRGQEPLEGAPGWRLLFDLENGATAFLPGQLVEIEVQPAADSAPPAGACAVGPGGGTVVWIRSAPERFAERKVTDCDAPLQLAAGERLVTQGAALLSQYH